MKKAMEIVACLLLFSSIHAMASEGNVGPEGTVVNIGSQEELSKMLEYIESAGNRTEFLMKSMSNPGHINNSLLSTGCTGCKQNRVVSGERYLTEPGTTRGSRCECCLHRNNQKSTNAGSSCSMWSSYDERHDTLSGCCSVAPYNCNVKCSS
jgi:hypothetical protein